MILDYKKVLNSKIFVIGIILSYIALFFYQAITIIVNITNSFKESLLLEAVAKNNLFFWPEDVLDDASLVLKLLRNFDIYVLHTGGWFLFMVNLVSFFYIFYIFYILLQSILKDLSKREQLLLASFLFIVWFSKIEIVNIIWEFKGLSFLSLSLLFSSFILASGVFHASRLKTLLFATVLLLGSILFFPYNVFALPFFLILLFISKRRTFDVIISISLLVLIIYSLLGRDVSFHFYGFSIVKILNNLGGVFFVVSSGKLVTVPTFMGLFMVGGIAYILYKFKVQYPNDRGVILLVVLLYALFFQTLLRGLLSLSDNSFLYRYEYFSYDIVLWTLFLIVLYYFAPQKSRSILKYIFVLCLGILVGYQFTSYSKSYKYNYSLYKTAQEELNLKELQQLYPQVARSNREEIDSFFNKKEVQQYMQEHRYFLTFKPIGTKILSNKYSSGLIGFVDKSYYLPHGNKTLKLIGWIYNKEKKDVPKMLYIINSQNTIVGYVFAVDKPRLDVKKLFGRRALYSGFIGYIESKNISDGDKLFFVDRNEQYKQEFILSKEKKR